VEDRDRVTEIPEHLLKRSKERRAAIGGEAGAEEGTPAGTEVEASADAPAAAPVAAAAATPAPVPAAPPPKPVRPEVAAALRRRKIPVWALPVLVSLPLWAYVYQATLEPPPKPASTPIALGQVEYAECAACHSADGSGGVGPALTGVRETWPDYRDHMAWVRLGSAGWPTDTYGATDKAKKGGMPPHPAMTDAQLAEVVLYERATFGGLQPTDKEYTDLEAIALGTSTFKSAGLGPLSQKDGVDPAVETQGG
jgi:mono/diheme cytochrome c family protein